MKFPRLLTLFQESRSVTDEAGQILWTFMDPELPFSPNFRPWETVVCRLSYIHLFDNLIHVLWLRYLSPTAPYTTYLNNSELLIVLLSINVALYTYGRICSHVVTAQEGDEEFLTQTRQESKACL